MELTPADQRRIEEEERRRFAEEQFRASVRTQLRQTSVEPPRSVGPAKYRRSLHPLALGTLIGAVVVGAIALFVHFFPGASSTTTAIPGPSSTATQPTATKGVTARQVTKDVDAPAPPVAMTPAQIFNRSSGSIVLLENHDSENQLVARGTGFVVKAGLVATNYHVIRGAARLVARSTDSSSFEASEIMGFDPDADAAIVRFSGLQAGAVNIGAADSLHRGDHVTAIGAPLGIQNTLSEGIVTNLLRLPNGSRLIQISAPISHGSSGGPLFNDLGQVVGITTAARPEGELVNFALPISEVNRILLNPREMSFTQFLTETRVVTSISNSSFTVPHGGVTPLQFQVPANHLATLEGSFSIYGGRGNDIDFELLQGSGGQWRVVAGGIRRLIGGGNINESLPSGTYAIVFSNKFSTFSAKTISGDIHLVSFR